MSLFFLFLFLSTAVSLQIPNYLIFQVLKKLQIFTSTRPSLAYYFIFEFTTPKAPVSTGKPKPHEGQRLIQSRHAKFMEKSATLRFAQPAAISSKQINHWVHGSLLEVELTVQAASKQYLIGLACYGSLYVASWSPYIIMAMADVHQRLATTSARQQRSSCTCQRESDERSIVYARKFSGLETRYKMWTC